MIISLAKLIVEAATANEPKTTAEYGVDKLAQAARAVYRENSHGFSYEFGDDSVIHVVYSASPPRITYDN